jgi:hypothetical protein
MCIPISVHKPPAEGNFCMNMEELINLPSLKTTVSTRATLSKGTEWLIAIQLVGEHESDQKLYFSMLKVQRQPVYRFSYFPYKGKLLYEPSVITMGKLLGA